MSRWFADTAEQFIDFSNVLNISIAASWMVLAVIILRLILKKAPKGIHVALWGLVAVRLLLPFSIESVFSLIPSTETIPQEILLYEGSQLQDSAFLDVVSNHVYSGSFTVDLGETVDRVQINLVQITPIWIAGMAALIAYAVVSYWQLRNRVNEAVILRDNIYQSEHIGSPFVLGMIHPKIYLPYHIGEQDICHVVAHEQAHICRRDHWWKPIGFLLLTIHWFNPLMWLAYILLCRDIELACDEKVIKEMSNEQRADYTQVLVVCSVNQRMIKACPLAFGEVGVKERVKSVMNYKRPTFWGIAMAISSCVVVAVCFLTDPRGIKIKDITHEKEYTITRQVKKDLTLSIPKASLPDAIYTNEGYTFEENEIVAYQTDTSTIYLEQVMLSNEGAEYLYFIFNYSYNLRESGSVLLPYEIKGTGDDWLYSPFAQPSSNTLMDDVRIYEDTVHLRANGPSEQFAFYVAADACKAADGTIRIQMICNELSYVKNSSNLHKISDIDESLGIRLALDDVIWLSENEEDLSWEDFDRFPYVETGSGLYIRIYEIDELFHLAIGGAGPNRDPMYIYLGVYGDEPNARIDIRNGGVAEFIEQHQARIHHSD